MGASLSHELIGRQLPPGPAVRVGDHQGDVVNAEELRVYREAHEGLIAELRQRLFEMESKAATRMTSTDAFNHMVRLGNQSAERIVAKAHDVATQLEADAHARAAQIVAHAQCAADAQLAAGFVAPASDVEPEPPIVVNPFGEAWEKAASIDERFADRAFFENEYDEPSRRWILADV